MKDISQFITSKVQLNRLKDILEHATKLPVSISLNDEFSDHAFLNEKQILSHDEVREIHVKDLKYLIKTLSKDEESIGHIICGPYVKLSSSELSIITSELLMMSDINHLPSSIVNIQGTDLFATQSNQLDLVNTLMHYDLIDVIYSLSKCMKSGDEKASEALIIELFHQLSSNGQDLSIDLMKHYLMFAFASITFDLINAGYHLDLNVLVLHNFVINLSARTDLPSLESYCVEFFKGYLHERLKRDIKLYTYPVNEVIKNIRESFQTDISLKDIALELGYSQRHLSRIIKTNTHKTFKELLNLERLQYAKLLLKEEEYTIAEVVEHSGFSSISRFYAFFKEHESMTPSQYRRMFG